MEPFVELLKLLIPASAVLYAMYITVKIFLNRDYERKMLEIRAKTNETVLPIRLQAYERICLFLERIAPNNMIVRVNNASLTSKELQSILLTEIREEFNHNLSQQLYMSDEAWNLTKIAMEEVVSVINTSSSEVDGESKSLELAKKIFEKMLDRENDPIGTALVFLKDEIRQFY